MPPAPSQTDASQTANRRMRELQRGADRVCSLILDDDYPDVDIQIAIERLRELAEEWFPGTEELFVRIYESRFERLRQQFRRAGG